MDAFIILANFEQRKGIIQCRLNVAGRASRGAVGRAGAPGGIEVFCAAVGSSAAAEPVEFWVVVAVVWRRQLGSAGGGDDRTTRNEVRPSRTVT